MVITEINAHPKLFPYVIELHLGLGKLGCFKEVTCFIDLGSTATVKPVTMPRQQPRNRSNTIHLTYNLTYTPEPRSPATCPKCRTPS